MKKIGIAIRIALLCVCAAVFVLSVITLVNILGEYLKADNFYENVNEDIKDFLTDDGNDVENKAPDRLIKLSEYVRELRATYPDVVGYINIPNLADGDKGISYSYCNADFFH